MSNGQTLTHKRIREIQNEETRIVREVTAEDVQRLWDQLDAFRTARSLEREIIYGECPTTGYMPPEACYAPARKSKDTLEMRRSMRRKARVASRLRRLASYATNPDTGFRPPEDRRAPVKRARRGQFA